MEHNIFSQKTEHTNYLTQLFLPPNLTAEGMNNRYRFCYEEEETVTEYGNTLICNRSYEIEGRLIYDF